MAKHKQAIPRIAVKSIQYNPILPYQEIDESQVGGSGFFVDGKSIGLPEIPGTRTVLTNFHVIQDTHDRKCALHFPANGSDALTAHVKFVVPGLDIAVLEVRPSGHPLWIGNNSGLHVTDFIDSIPNLPVNPNPIACNNQKVYAYGYPNSTDDIQVCEGNCSGRDMGMMQVSMSLNGGNSGGPLMLANKVVGVNTATVGDSEGLALCVSIHQVVRLFRHWYRDNREGPIVKIPSWGMSFDITTPSYLTYHGVDHAIQGCNIKRLIPHGAADVAKIKVGDIVTGIESGGKRYNVNNSGMVRVPWTNKLVPIDNTEFILGLDPDDIKFSLFRWTSKTSMKAGVPVTPTPLDFQVREVFPQWEPIDYCILGGCVFMNLTMNHLERPDEEDEEPLCTNPVPLISFIGETMNMESAVVVTYIPPQSHVSTNKSLKTFDRILKCQNKKVRNASHLASIVRDHLTTSYNKRSASAKDKFIVLETPDGRYYLDIEQLRLHEETDAMTRPFYPTEKCLLLGHAQSAKATKARKRRRTQ